MVKVNCIVKLVANVLSIILTFILGICLMTTSYSGSYEGNSSYGGDAYTGIQNAAAETANNVYYLGKTVTGITQTVGCVGGMLLTVQFIKNTVKSVEEVIVVFKKKKQQ